MVKEQILHHKVYGGDASAPVLIILHGLFGMLDNWHNIAGKLDDGFRVVTVDQRNHGRSFHHAQMNLDLMAGDLEVLADQLGLDRFHLLGHSMGGKVALHFAITHPGRVHKLVVADIAPRAYKPGHDIIFDAMWRLPLTSISSREAAEERLATDIPQKSVRLFILKNIERKAEGGYKWKLNLESIHKNYSELLQAIETPWPYSGDVLFMRGEQSGYITEEDILHIPEQFPNAKFVRIPNAGHWLHAENPPAFLQSLRSFLNS